MDHHRFLERCVQLARNGKYVVAPNPMVGSVIVHHNQIIGEGFHTGFGKPHAEVEAISSVTEVHKLPESTIYVSLEPCSHFGKTPPCADLILKTGIRRVVIGCMDPNPLVSGRGVQKLKDGGAEVILMDSKPCREVLNGFYTFHALGRPYIFLKWAQSADGFLDGPQPLKGGYPISTLYSRQISHKFRSICGAVLVGKQTWIDDQPQLDSRLWDQKSIKKFVLSNSQLALADGFERVASIEAFLDRCREQNILQVWIEGGKSTLESFIQSGLWDEALVFQSNTPSQGRTRAPQIDKKAHSMEDLVGGDVLVTYRND